VTQYIYYLLLGFQKRGLYSFDVTIITNNISLKHGILKSLLKNYVDYPLFRYFLYPCIEWDTHLKIGDTTIFDHAFSYLYDCCKKAETRSTIKHKEKSTWRDDFSHGISLNKDLDGIG
jgi:hypothetical protein